MSARRNHSEPQYARHGKQSAEKDGAEVALHIGSRVYHYRTDSEKKEPKSNRGIVNELDLISTVERPTLPSTILASMMSERRFDRITCHSIDYPGHPTRH